MGETTKISWTHATFSPWWGCTNVSPGCDLCYAEGTSIRWGFDIWGKNAARRFFGEKHWNEPLKWNRKAGEQGERRRVFCASMCDILEEWRPTPGEEGRMDSERIRLWELIEQTPNLDWLLLTKRPQNYVKMLPETWLRRPRHNVWIMTTVEAPAYTWRINEILKIPAAVHAVSWEPALDYVDFKSWTPERCCNGVDCGCMGKPIHPPPYLNWVIGGGESGPGCRPFDMAWARRVGSDLAATSTSYFVKQLGGHPDKRDVPAEWPADLRIQQFPVARAGAWYC